VIQYIKRRENDGEDDCVDELKHLLDYTQWWDWDFTPPNGEHIHSCQRGRKWDSG